MNREFKSLNRISQDRDTTDKARLVKPRALTASIAMALGVTVPAAFVVPVNAQDGGGMLEEITVTGSRIVRRDMDAASPIVTIDSEAFENTATLGIETALNRMPQFIPGGSNGGPNAGTQFGTGDVQASAFNSPGISVVNLRGVGTNRNLVLVDSRRGQPANATLNVDVNTIPASLIDRVEVITGGASAAYGADAIGGVINFILKDDFEGMEFDAQTSVTQHGGGQESRITALVGGNFDGGRGNAVVALEWSKRDAVARLERDYYVRGFLDPGTAGTLFFPGNTYYTSDFGQSLDQTVIDGIFPTAATPVPGSSQFFFNNNGTPYEATPYIREQGGLGYTGELEPLRKVGTDNVLDENSIYALVSSPLERYSIFGKAEYEFFDDINFYVQGTFTSVEVNQILQQSPAVQIWSASIPYNQLYDDPDSATFGPDPVTGAHHPVPSALADLLNSRTTIDPVTMNPVSAAGANWTLNRSLDFIGDRKSENISTTYQVMAGFEGALPFKDWTFDLYYSHGETNIVNFLEGFASLERWQDVVTANNYGRNYTNDVGLGYNINCTTGLPIFADFTPSRDCVEAISSNMKNWNFLTQDIAEFSMQGGITELPAGELRGAIGVAYRKNDVRFEPDLLNDAESIIDNPVGLFAANNTGGETEVKELFIEALVPVVRDLPFMQTFNLELGARLSDWNTTGGIETWKAMYTWDVNDYVRLRGGYQLANRAPNTAELFTGPTLAVVGFGPSDPCTNVTTAPWGNVASNPDRAMVQALCGAIINASGANNDSTFHTNPDGFSGPFGFFPLEIAVISGNEDITNEEAKTWTIGAVLQSPMDDGIFSNLNGTIDFYSIRITDAIQPLSALTVYEKCFNADGVSNPTYAFNDPGGFCALINRLPIDGARNQVQTPYFNLGGIKTRGIDITANWGFEALDGNWMVNFGTTIIDTYQTQPVSGEPFVENVGTLAEGGQFDYRLNTTLTYSRDQWYLSLNHRFLPSIADTTAATDPNTVILGAGSHNMFDLFGGYTVNEMISLRFGIENLMDRDPETTGANPGVNNNIGTTNAGYYDPLGRRFFAGVKFTF